MEQNSFEPSEPSKAGRVSGDGKIVPMFDNTDVPGASVTVGDACSAALKQIPAATKNAKDGGTPTTWHVYGGETLKRCGRYLTRLSESPIATADLASLDRETAIKAAIGVCTGRLPSYDACRNALQVLEYAAADVNIRVPCERLSKDEYRRYIQDDSILAGRRETFAKMCGRVMGKLNAQLASHAPGGEFGGASCGRIEMEHIQGRLRWWQGSKLRSKMVEEITSDEVHTMVKVSAGRPVKRKTWEAYLRTLELAFIEGGYKNHPAFASPGRAPTPVAVGSCQPQGPRMSSVDMTGPEMCDELKTALGLTADAFEKLAAFIANGTALAAANTVPIEKHKAALKRIAELEGRLANVRRLAG